MGIGCRLSAASHQKSLRFLGSNPTGEVVRP